MITLYDVMTKDLVEVERLAVETDDHVYVSIRLVRALLARVKTDLQTKDEELARFRDSATQCGS